MIALLCIVVSIILIFLPALPFLLPLIMITMFCGMLLDPKFYESHGSDNLSDEYVVLVYDNTKWVTKFSKKEWEIMVAEDPNVFKGLYSKVYLNS